MENKKSSVAILATMAMMSAQSTYLNYLDELTDSDRPRSSVSYAKRNLTKKQTIETGIKTTTNSQGQTVACGKYIY